MIPRLLAETRQRFSRLARDIVQQTPQRYAVRHSQLADINITGSELSPRLRALPRHGENGDIVRGFKNPCHSGIPHGPRTNQIPRTNVPRVLQGKYHVCTANTYRVQALIFTDRFSEETISLYHLAETKMMNKKKITSS